MKLQYKKGKPCKEISTICIDAYSSRRMQALANHPEGLQKAQEHNLSKTLFVLRYVCNHRTSDYRMLRGLQLNGNPHAYQILMK